MSNDTSITATLCPDEERLDFLPHYCGKHFLQFENSVFAIMQEYATDYNGGYWQFYRLSNGGFYIALEDDKRHQVENPNNYFSGEMSTEALSLGVNLFALNVLTWKTEDQKLVDHYYALRDFASEHAEAAQIMGFID